MTKDEKRKLARRAQALRAEGWSLFLIACTLKVSKDWLREYAGI